MLWIMLIAHITHYGMFLFNAAVTFLKTTAKEPTRTDSFLPTQINSIINS